MKDSIQERMADWLKRLTPVGATARGFVYLVVGGLAFRALAYFFTVVAVLAEPFFSEWWARYWRFSWPRRCAFTCSAWWCRRSSESELQSSLIGRKFLQPAQGRSLPPLRIRPNHAQAPVIFQNHRLDLP